MCCFIFNGCFGNDQWMDKEIAFIVIIIIIIIITK